jgi:hypothetical protein
MTQSSIICGRVTRIGYYRDTLPLLVISILKREAALLPWQDGERVPVPLSMNGEIYLAGIRSTLRSTRITISPDLVDRSGNSIRLTDLLLQHNIQQRATVALCWECDNKRLSLL